MKLVFLCRHAIGSAAASRCPFLPELMLTVLPGGRISFKHFWRGDIPQWGIGTPAMALLRFWTMLAHYHGQTWNAAEPARSLGVSEPTVRRYLDILSGVFMIRQLTPWHANLKKRQVKAPKIYFRDTGLLHQLLGIRSEKELLSHPKCGASWEGYVIEETIKATEPDEVYYWATHSGAEIDLVLIKNGRMLGVECKRMDAPRITPSMRIAREELNLEQIAVVYPGRKRYALGSGGSRSAPQRSGRGNEGTVSKKVKVPYVTDNR